jgi:hypothetical protein
MRALNIYLVIIIEATIKIIFFCNSLDRFFLISIKNKNGI